jgi:hypothetical protein
MAENPADRCELCSRSAANLTRHHFIPRTRHRNRKNKQLFDRAEVRERIAWLCRPCHKQVHTVLDEKQLEREYSTVESLASHPEIAAFVDWIRDKPMDLVVPAFRRWQRRRR